MGLLLFFFVLIWGFVALYVIQKSLELGIFMRVI